MDEQKLSLTVATIYVIAAFALICMFSVCGSRSSAVTIQASAEGYKGTITVEVSVADEKIKGAKLIASEDSDFTKPVVEGILAQAVKKGTVANLDIVSGATYSSKATISALETAIEKAKDPVQ